MDKRNKKMTVTHKRTTEILKAHGWTPRTNTMANKGQEVLNTSFFDDFGIKQHYIYREVMEWLGY